LKVLFNNKHSGCEDNILEAFLKPYEVKTNKILEIAGNFKKSLSLGLNGQGPLMMLPSYIGKPCGNERGTYIALDIGGTNIRAARITLDHKQIFYEAEVTTSFKNPELLIDYSTNRTTAEELYDYIAEIISTIIKKEEKYFLGFTFSFPVKQENILNATLIRWVKEIDVTGAVGEDPSKLLLDALLRKKLNIRPAAMINDTVGTFLHAAWIEKETDIASIVGTGHNTCYLQENHELTGKPMIVNMESANFNIGLPYTQIDKALDENSSFPGTAQLEKMVSGVYLGELVRRILLDLNDHGLRLKGKIFKKNINHPYSLEARDISEFLCDSKNITDFFSCTNSEAEMINNICQLIVKRSARLVAATYIGTVLHIDERLDKKHVIAIDGSVYEKMPYFREEVSSTIKEVLGEKSDHIKAVLVKGGSGAGAAIAAAIAVNSSFTVSR